MQKEAPAFHETSIASPIAEVALPLYALKDGIPFASGTAIIIANNIAITAAHVIDDFTRQFDNLSIEELSNKNSYTATFSLQAIQCLKSGKSGFVWDITKLWGCKFTDIAVLRLSPTVEEQRHHQWRLPKLQMTPPKIGEKIFAFGYSRPDANNNTNGMTLTVDGRTAIGDVIEVHHLQRDQRLNFPCFQTNARFDGGMSGGPVFNESGYLCGLVCSNLPPIESNEDHVSYVTSIWPLMGLKIDMNRKNSPIDITYPMYELAKDEFMTVIDLDKISLLSDGKTALTP